MEGKYTKASALIGVLALGIAIWQIIPATSNNFSGEWRIISKIKGAEMKKYVGMTIEWRFHLMQTGDRIKGAAEKITVNSNKLDYSERVTLTLEGSVEGSSFAINYTEKGKLRTTTGTFKGEFLNKNSLNGDFSSTASDSYGSISGSRVK